jgi:hypothetical protein
MAAIAAPLDVAAESSGAAVLDRDHGTTPRRGQRRNTSATSSPSWATKPSLYAGTRSGAVGTRAVSDSSGLVVAHTLLVAIIRY